MAANIWTKGNNMAIEEEIPFSELVTMGFSAEQEEARSLWVPLAQEFNSLGPDAVREYVAAERQRLVERVHKLVAEVEERFNG